MLRGGYVEFPSRLAESSRGWESDRIAGLNHHRWLIEVDEPNQHVCFTIKCHMIHSHWRFSFPPDFLRATKEEERVSWLFWEGGFTWREARLVGLEAIASDLQRYVERIRPYPRWQLEADRVTRRSAGLLRRALRKLPSFP